MTAAAIPPFKELELIKMELKSDIKAVNTELDNRIDLVKIELDNKIDSVKNDISNLEKNNKWIFSLTFALWLTVLGGFIALILK